MKNNKSNLIIMIVLGIILVISLIFIFSGLTEKEEQKPIENNEVLETGISLSASSIKMEVGEEQEIVATVVPTNATYQNLSWEVGNPSIINLDNGKVKGLSPGTTFIKITTEKQKIARVINVTVVTNTIPITEIKAKEDNIELYVGDSKKIEYEIIPSDATNTKISYSTDNKEVVGFNKEGLLVGVKEGTAIITLKSTNDIKTTIKVAVKNKEIPVNSISISPSKTTIKIGETKELKTKFNPTNATDKTITWESSDPKVATVDNGLVKAISVGTTKITVKTSNGKTATSNITVKEDKKINKIHFIKQSIKTVNPSDAILLESNGHYAMVDTGMKTTEDNKFVYNYLKSVGVKELDFILITHNHDDHIGGAEYLIKSDITVKKFYIKTYIGKDSDSGSGTKNYNNVINALNSKNIPVVYIDKSFTDGKSFNFYDMDIKLYNTAQIMNQKGYVGGNENYNSVMELITIGNKKVFLTGDSYSGSIMDNVSKQVGKVDVMKMPHHGFATCSMNAERAKRLSPSYLIVTNAKINDCLKNFNSNIPTYFTKASSKDAIVVDIGDKINIIN